MVTKQVEFSVSCQSLEHKKSALLVTLVTEDGKTQEISKSAVEVANHKCPHFPTFSAQVPTPATTKVRFAILTKNHPYAVLTIDLADLKATPTKIERPLEDPKKGTKLGSSKIFVTYHDISPPNKDPVSDHVTPGAAAAPPPIVIPETPRFKPLGELNSEELIAVMLHRDGMNLPLEDCVEIFQRKRFGGFDLLQIDNQEELEKEGIKSKPHRARILKFIEDAGKTGVSSALFSSSPGQAIAGANYGTMTVACNIPSPHRDYIITKELVTKNGNCRVLLAFNKKQGESGGLSLIKICQNAADFNRERANLRMFSDCRAVVKLEDYDESTNCLILKYLGSTSLGSYIKNGGALDKADRDHKALQLCHALKELHRKGMAHLDLKPENVMLYGKDGVVSLKLIDFDCMAADGSTGVKGFTPMYCAPEIAANAGSLDKVKVTLASDIFSLGLILYEMYNKDRCRPMFTEADVAVKTLADYHNSGAPLPINRAETLPVILQMLLPNPMERPTITTLLEQFDNSFTHVRRASQVLGKVDALRESVMETKDAIDALHRTFARNLEQMNQMQACAQGLLMVNEENRRMFHDGIVSLHRALETTKGEINEEVRRSANRTTNSIVRVLHDFHSSFPRLLMLIPADGIQRWQKGATKLGLKDYFDVVFLCEQPLLEQNYPDSAHVGHGSPMANEKCTASCNQTKKTKKKVDVRDYVAVHDKIKLAAHEVEKCLKWILKAESKTSGGDWFCSHIGTHKKVGDTWYLVLDLTSKTVCNQLHVNVSMTTKAVNVTERIQLRHPVVPVSISGKTIRKLAPVLRVVATLLKVAAVVGSIYGLRLPDGTMFPDFTEMYWDTLEGIVADKKPVTDKAKAEKLHGEAFVELQKLLKSHGVEAKDGQLTNIGLSRLTTRAGGDDIDFMEVVWLCPAHAKMAKQLYGWHE